MSNRNKKKIKKEKSMIKQHIQKTLLICFFGIALTGCGNAETAEVQSQETKIETTTTVKAVSETQKQIDKEIKKAENKQKVYTENDYKQFFYDEYFAALKVEGDFIIVSYYQEDEDCNIDKTLPTEQTSYYKSQADYLLNLKSQKKNLIKTYKSKISANNKKERIITEYVLNDDQRIVFPEGQRPLVKEHEMSEYIIELYAQGQAVNLSSQLTNQELAKINHDKSQQKQAEIRARNQEENERRLAERDERVEQLTQELQEKQAEGQAKRAYIQGARDIWENAQHEYHRLMNEYADHYGDPSKYDGSSMKNPDPGFKRVAHSSTVESFIIVLIKESDYPAFQSEVTDIMNDAISELQEYDDGSENAKQIPSLISSLQGIIKTVNQLGR